VWLGRVSMQKSVDAVLIFEVAILQRLRSYDDQTEFQTRDRAGSSGFPALPVGAAGLQPPGTIWNLKNAVKGIDVTVWRATRGRITWRTRQCKVIQQ
jgi:hypothetical protein